MFGDGGWDASREEVQSAHYQNWLASLSKGKLVIVECGAGTAVPTVRFQSERIARLLDARVIRINIREPHIFPPHLPISQGAAEALTAIERLR